MLAKGKLNLLLSANLRQFSAKELKGKKGSRKRRERTNKTTDDNQ